MVRRKAQMLLLVLLWLGLAGWPVSAQPLDPGGSRVADPWYPPLPRADGPGQSVQPPPIRFKVQVGLDRRGRSNLIDSWTPVTIWFLSNHTKASSLAVTLTAEDFSGQTGGSRVQTTVSVPPLGERVLRTAVFLGSGDSRIQVRVDPGDKEQGPPLSHFVSALTVGASTNVFAVLARDPNGGRDPGVGDDRRHPHDMLQPYYSPAVFAHPAIETLPDRWFCYATTRAIIVSDPEIVDSLSDLQWAAVLDYLRSGGRVIVEATGPEGAAACGKGRLAALVPASVEPGGNRNRLQLKSRAAWSGGSPGDFWGAPDHVTTSSTCAQGAFGLGQVFVTTLSLADVRSPWDESDRARVLGGRDDQGATGDPLQNAETVGQRMNVSLKAQEVAQIPSHNVLLVFLLVYCIVVGPLARWGFSRVERPLAAWVSLPLIVAVFILIAWNQMAARWPSSPFVREITVVQTRSGLAHGVKTSYLGLFSPTQTTYRIEMASPDVAFRYLDLKERRGLDREALSFVEQRLAEPGRPAGFRYGVDGLLMSARSRVTFGVRQLATFSEPLTLELQQSGADVKQITLRNPLPVSLDGGFVALAGQRGLVRVSRLRPGERVQTPVNQSWYPSDAEIAQEILKESPDWQAALVELLGVVKTTRRSGYLVAWTRNSTSDVAVMHGAATSPGIAQRTGLTIYVVDAEEVGRP